MRILIDNQYKEIYEGEFKNWVELCIIGQLKQENIIDFPKSIEETKNFLEMNEYDLVIITGYNPSILNFVDDKKYPTKVACIIYDMNAEKLLNFISDNGNISEIVSFKSRLIFLSSYIICHNKTVKKEIEEAYESYKEYVDIASKFIDIDYQFKFNEIAKKKLIKEKYILIKESINGLTFLTREFIEFVDIVINSKEVPSNFIFVIICKKFPKTLWDKIKNTDKIDNFKILTDVSENEIKILQAGAIANMFISSFDNDFDSVCSSILSKSICITNIENDSFNDFLEEAALGIPFNINYDLMKDVFDIIRSSKKDRERLIDMQISKVESIIQSTKPLKII